jgi:hypothetical protein
MSKILQEFFFPNEWKTIQAESLEEALKILNANDKENVSSNKKSVSTKK